MPAYKLYFRHLTEAELELVYNTEMKQNFQPDELKPFYMIQNDCHAENMTHSFVLKVEVLTHTKYNAYKVIGIFHSEQVANDLLLLKSLTSAAAKAGFIAFDALFSLFHEHLTLRNE